MRTDKTFLFVLVIIFTAGFASLLMPSFGRAALQHHVYLPLAIKAGTVLPPPATATATPTATASATVASSTMTATPSATQTQPSISTPTPTPTPTATATTTAEPPLLLIDNGDFEQGSTKGSGWFEYRSYSNRPLIVQSVEGLSVTPRSGEWFAWLGGDNLLGETINHRSHIIHYDTFTLPNGPVYLHAYVQIISEQQPNIEGDCVYDWFFVWINNIIMETVPLCEQSNTNGWTLGTVNLSQFAGQNITLEFQVRTDGEELSHIFLDDVSFQSTP